MKRTFIGLKIEPDSRIFQLYRELKSNLKYPQLHWIDPDNLHLTLRFLGDTEESQIETIIKQLDSMIPQYNVSDLEINGLGIFGSPTYPRILWAGIKMPENIFNMVKNIENIVCEVGFEREKRAYSPHLTLCRIKNLKETAELFHFIGKYKDSFLKNQEVKEINLYESILQRTGSVYQIMHTFFLNKN